MFPSIKNCKLTILLLLLTTNSLYSQKKDIFFSEYKKYVYNYIIGDTLSINFSSSIKYKIVIKDSLGKSYLAKYNNDRLIEFGEYENGLGILKKYVSIRGVNKIYIKEYYQPLRSGKWSFYRKNKWIIINYLKGIKVKNPPTILH